MDLGRSQQAVQLHDESWEVDGTKYPYLQKCKDNTVYYWDGTEFSVVARYSNSLIKLISTNWGPPTFQIDGVKMLPTAKLSPFEDAKNKVELIQPRGKVVLDTCGGLGYFASWCLEFGAKQIRSFELNPDVLWLRKHNPWSPQEGDDERLQITQGDVGEEITTLAAHSVDAILHDPPRFALCGELYSQEFYNHLGRVLRKRGLLFHYTGAPNKLTSGRNFPKEVTKRLQKSGFKVRQRGDGFLCHKL